ncbi:MAG: hypothetical protein KBD01_10145, partial [Acidobacteria bacterium]|nr:hypothetical protein [Acidobacteriota bacterium]
MLPLPPPLLLPALPLDLPGLLPPRLALPRGAEPALGRELSPRGAGATLGRELSRRGAGVALGRE